MLMTAETKMTCKETRKGDAAERDDAEMSVQDVADYLGVSVWLVYQWRHRGFGPKSKKRANRVIYRRSDVDAFKRAHARVRYMK